MTEKNSGEQKGAPAPTSPNVFTLRADKAARSLGLTPDEMTLVINTHLTRGVDWDIVNRHRTLSPDGLARLRSTLEAPVAAPARKPRALLAAPGAAPITFRGELIVHRTPLRNRQLVIAYIPGADPNDPNCLVNVIVRANENFLPGMTMVRIRHVNGINYEATGNMPRRRGRY